LDATWEEDEQEATLLQRKEERISQLRVNQTELEALAGQLEACEMHFDDIEAKSKEAEEKVMELFLAEQEFVGQQDVHGAQLAEATQLVEQLEEELYQLELHHQEGSAEYRRRREDLIFATEEVDQLTIGLTEAEERLKELKESESKMSSIQEGWTIQLQRAEERLVECEDAQTLAIAGVLELEREERELEDLCARLAHKESTLQQRTEDLSQSPETSIWREEMVSEDDISDYLPVEVESSTVCDSVADQMPAIRWSELHAAEELREPCAADGPDRATEDAKSHTSDTTPSSISDVSPVSFRPLRRKKDRASTATQETTEKGTQQSDKQVQKPNSTVDSKMDEKQLHWAAWEAIRRAEMQEANEITLSAPLSHREHTPGNGKDERACALPGITDGIGCTQQ